MIDPDLRIRGNGNQQSHEIVLDLVRGQRRDCVEDVGFDFPVVVLVKMCDRGDDGEGMGIRNPGGVGFRELRIST